MFSSLRKSKTSSLTVLCPRARLPKVYSNAKVGFGGSSLQDGKKNATVFTFINKFYLKDDSTFISFDSL